MNYFQKYLAEEYAEEYSEGRVSRRDALKIIASITGSLVMANSILAACSPPPEATAPLSLAAPSPTAAPQIEASPTESSAAAASTATPTPAGQPRPGAPAPHGTVNPDDPAIRAGAQEFPGEDGQTLQGYLSYPAGEASYPVILVCHENRGLTPHIQDVTRRLAKAGYAALAVDLLSREGGTASLSSDQVPGILSNTPPEQFVADFISGWRFLGEQPFALTERVGMMGFCFGGGVTWLMTTRMPELKAAVPFYGPHPSLQDVPDINAAVQAVYGELDTRINQGIPAIEEAMQANNKIFNKLVYPNADHAFFNDTGSRYVPEAAQDAWEQTLTWFAQYV
jgi:carboxymethylenebutenolidase